MRGIKKSRNGCAICKSKRIKCDELRPSCGRCSRLGLECPGYSQTLRWVSKKREIARDTSESRNPPASTGGNRTGEKRNDGMYPDSRNDSGQRPHRLSLLDDLVSVTNNELNAEQWNICFGTNLQQNNDLCASPTGISQSFDFAQLQASGNSSPSHRREPDPQASQPTEPSSLVSESGIPLNEGFIPRQSSPIDLFPSSDGLSIPIPLGRSLEYRPCVLVEYYFKEVAGLFSSYDSQMNPFRNTVSRLWTSSPALNSTLQSMAAAALVDDFPYLGPVGIKMRSQAISILEEQALMDEKSLLALLMLGQTASWHNPNDLGLSFFNLLRNYINAFSPFDSSPLLTDHNYQFFEQALVYWEMLLSFVADHRALLPSTETSLPTASRNALAERVPHPWTGFARDIQFVVNEIGRLIRRERNRVRSTRLTTQRDIAQAQRAIQTARSLEEKLLRIENPSEMDVVNPGDGKTPVWHLLAVAEVYRYTGLIQLYHIFPDLLRSRLRLGGQGPLPIASLSALSEQDSTSAFDALFADTGIPYHPFNDAANSSNTVFDGTEDDLLAPAYNAWLTQFTLTAMSRLKTIPLESRTRCLQPFLLVAMSSELRMGPTDDVSALGIGGTSDSAEQAVNLQPHIIDAARTRQFVLGRLNSLLHILPPKPIGICLQIVKEVWRRMDAGEPEVYWMDVMIDNGWETTMG